MPLVRLMPFLLLHLIFAKDVVGEIKDYIKAAYQRTYPEINIESISLIARSTLPLPSLEILSKHIPSIKSPQGYITINYKQGQSILQESVKYSIQATITIYTANRNLAAKTNISTDSITAKTQAFSTMAVIPASRQEILQSSARLSIPANSIISQNKLSKRVLVQKDSVVKILVSIEGVEALTQGRALEAGLGGDLIKVENLESKRVIQAEVVGENAVRLR